jgi:hypothetical protein
MTISVTRQAQCKWWLRQFVLGGVLAPLLCLVSACRKEPAVSPAPDVCGTAAGEPVFESPRPVGAVPSQVTIEVLAATSWLKSQIESEVPTQLAEGEQSVGVPGRVSYKVHRGAFGFDLAGSSLVVSTPVTADVSLCKPIAGFCPVLGRCSPNLSVTATVPLVLDESCRIGKTEVRTELVRGCRILGFDVSEEVSSRAAKEARKVERQIESMRARLQPGLEMGWELLRQPLTLGSLGCLQIRPERALQRTPKLEKGTLSTAVTLEGTLTLAPTCTNLAKVAKTSPRWEVSPQVPETHVQVPVPISWANTITELTRTIASSHATFSVKSLRARGVMEEGKPRVLLGLEVPGVCRTVWMTAQPRQAAEGRQVRLSDARPVLGYTGDMEVGQLQLLVEQVQTQAAIAVPVDVKRVRDQLLRLVDSAGRPPAGTKLEIAVLPSEGTVLVDDQGLVPVLGLTGKIRVKLQ